MDDGIINLRSINNQSEKYMNRTHFKDEEIPYHILERFGLSREMIGDLPMSILNLMLTGRKTPMLPIEMKYEDGSIIQSRTRIALIRKSDGTADVLFYPKPTENRLAMFSEAEQQKLRSGKPIMGQMVTNDAESETPGFHQLDDTNGQILSVPSPVIGRNLQHLSDTLHLSNAELICLRNGERLTVADDDDLLTIGIDLNEPTGVRIVAGDSRQWDERKKQAVEKYNFGCFGCWVMDEEGNLDYVQEEDYSDELWEEMKKSGARHAQAQKM